MKNRWLFLVAALSLLLAVGLTACGEKIKYRISVEEAVGGQIACTEEAAAGETVNITCTPDDGFAFKEGSLTVNGEPIAGNSFRMPAEDVTVTGEFVSADYKGTYVYYGYNAEKRGYLFEFIEVGERTLTIGETVTADGNFDCRISDSVPYEVENYVIKAMVNGEEWRAQIGIGTLIHGTYEYALSANVTLKGTYTEIPEQNGHFIERDYTFSDGTLVTTTYFGDGTETSENATYRMFGNFLYIEAPDTIYETDRIYYGVLIEQDGCLVFLHNYRFLEPSAGASHTFTDTLNVYPKREGQIALNEGGAYVFSGAVNPYNGMSWGEPACYDFIALRGGALAFSRHGVSYNGRLHFIDTDTEYLRFGNVLKVSYSLDGNDFALCFHIVDENTILLKSTMNYVEKFEFIQDVTFERAYGEPFTNVESPTEECRYYDDGVFGYLYFDKESGALVNANAGGRYRVYGNLLLVCSSSAGSDTYGIVEIVGQDPATSEYGCDYVLYSINGLWWDSICDGRSGAGIRFWKQVKGWE